MKGFLNFIREQGVIGLAIGFILGGAVSKTVSSLVNDIINPLLGIVLGAKEGLLNATVKIGTVQVKWGSFTGTLIDLAVIAAVVYFGVKGLKLESLDKKK